MEAVANGAADAIMKTYKIQKNIKEKKPRTSHVRTANNSVRRPHQIQNQKKLCFKKFALSLSKNSALQHVFPPDVEYAAIYPTKLAILWPCSSLILFSFSSKICSFYEGILVV